MKPIIHGIHKTLNTQYLQDLEMTSFLNVFSKSALKYENVEYIVNCIIKKDLTIWRLLHKLFLFIVILKKIHVEF